MTLSRKNIKKIEKLQIKRIQLRKARNALRNLRDTIPFRPEEALEIIGQEMDLDQDIMVVNKTIDSIIDGISSLPAPSKTALSKMKEAVKALEKINHDDLKTRAVFATIVDIATTVNDFT